MQYQISTFSILKSAIRRWADSWSGARNTATSLALLALLFLSFNQQASATLITLPYTFVPNTVIVSAQVNGNFTTITGVVNGNIDNSNLSTGANVSLSKLNNNQAFLDLQSVSGVSGLAVGQIGDTVGRIGLYSDGSIRWGVGGATAADIGIQRSGANTAQLFVPGGGTPVLDGGNGTVQNVNSLTAVTGTFTNLVVSGYPVGNYNNPPTTGTLTGEYWTSGNYSTTGNLTCNHVRLHVGGTVTIGNPVTVNTELLGGGGLGTVTVGRPGTAAGNDLSGVGGSYAGQGGQNGIGGPLTVLASTYFLDNYLGGSGGGNGDTPASTGGGGGGGLYIESNGNISITANITANGGVGVVGGATTAAGGGAGGAIDIRSIGTVTISGAATLSAVGGAGGVGASFGGGGGGGGCIRVRGSTVTNSGTVTVAGGAGGASASPGLAGGSGYTDVASGIIGPRSN